MATLEQTIAIIFRGDDKLSKTASAVGKSLSGVEDIVMGIASPLAQVGDAVLATDTALAAMAVGGLAYAVKQSGEFGDAFQEIATLIDDTDGAVNIFRSDILDYSRDSKKSIEDINSAIYTAISAGTDYKNSVDLLSKSEKLSIAGKAGLEASTKLLASSMNAYGESSDQATRYSDVFFKTVKLGQTTIPELAAHLAQVTGVASNAGIPIETLTSAIAALTATGMPTSQAITAIKAAISNIIKPSGEAAKLTGDLGVGFDATSLKARGFETVLWDVYKATDGDTAQIARLFGSVEGLNAALVLGADTSGKFKNALEEIGNSAGATEKAYAKMADNFALVNQNLANNMKATLVGIGDRVQGSYADIAGGVGDLLEAIGMAVDQGTFDPLFKDLNALGNRVTAFLKEVSKAMPEALAEIDWSGPLDALSDLGDELSGFLGDLDLTDPDDLATAIQGVVDTIGSLIRVTQGMLEYFRPLWDSIKEGISRFNELDEESKKSFGNVLGAAELVAKAGVKIGLALIAIKESGADIENVFNTIAGSVKFTWNTLQVAFDSVVRLIVEGIRDIIGMSAQIADIVPGMDGIAQKLYATYDSLNRFDTGVIANQAENMEEAVNGWRQAMAGLSGEAYQAEDSIKKMNAELEDFTGPVPLRRKIIVDVEGDEIDWIKETEDFTRQLDIVAGLDNESVKKVKEITEKELPSLKPMELDPQVDKAKLKAQTDVIENMLKYKAQVDIADIEAAMKKVEAAFDSIDTGIKSTGDLLSDLYGERTGATSWDQLAIDRQIREENKRRDQEFKLQEKLTNAQVELTQQKKASLERGDSLIKVQAEGLAPHLEMILWEILDKIQVRANEEGAEFLLGMA